MRARGTELLLKIVCETISADKAVVTIEGGAAHPGQAKNILVNALHLAAKLVMTLPHVTLTPVSTPSCHPQRLCRVILSDERGISVARDAVAGRRDAHAALSLTRGGIARAEGPHVAPHDESAWTLY